MTPLLVLVTACIIPAIEEDAEILSASRGRHRIAAIMDDIKAHAPTKKAAELIKNKLEKTSAELGLLLNVRKCGIYVSQTTDDEAEEDIPFLSIVRDGYKYLGLQQTERDTPVNMATLTQILEQKLAEILTSKLSPSQKVTLINNTLIPAAVYATGNLYPNEARATTLKKCADVDKKIRKALINHNLLGKTSTRALVYVPTSLGGLGIKSLVTETEAQYVRKYIYLQHHPDMKETEAEYKRLVAAGWRNPITDALHVMQAYELEIPAKEEPDEPLNAYCRRVVEKLRQAQVNRTLQSWTTSSHYARLVTKAAPKIRFPALADYRSDSWMATVARTAAEEQMHGLGANPARRRKCRLGCNADETAYHVMSACVTQEYTTRHDAAVRHVLHRILAGTRAPEHIRSQLRYGKAALVVEYAWGQRQIKIRAGTKVQTDPELYHNRPDIVVVATNPDTVYVFEIAVSHLQNIHRQEKIKQTRYGKNSTLHVTEKNYDTVPRDYNLVEALARMYKAPVKLSLMVFGALGEILETPGLASAYRHLQPLGATRDDLRDLENRCCRSICVATAKIIMRRLTMRPRDSE
ncbi:uncharacterized protein LOC106652661 [Trichogramma pretiosum]|uniref:uncharacterized protein LOC106652661 n=1 Tax=Trichogramma pretiosum TaxID=7493 RepID=UPI0006C947CA|nr:uncharacterized protein LOC106652661 [Trichogramma pretiosum]